VIPLLLAAAGVAAAVWCWPRPALALPAPRRPQKRPPLMARLGRPLAGRIPPPRFAGLGDDPRAEEARAGSVLVFGGVGAAAAVLLGGIGGVLALAVLGGFGWVYPDVRLRTADRRRTEAIEQGAPTALDLIASTVAAGVGIDVALAGAADATGGPLGDELATTVANLALGRRRGDELRDLAERTGSPSLGRLAAALRISDRLGVPLAASLRRQAERARAEQARRIQERAAVAAPKILLVVVFVLVPAALLPVMTALALTALDAVNGVAW
jgi:tight adherence protein C